MPFHLPAITRRQFLVRTVAGGASALAAQHGIAEEPSVDPDLWAFYSDSHIAESTAKFWRGEAMYDNARRVNREMFGLPKRPCGLIHFGDCAFKLGMPEDYVTFQSTIRAMPQAGIPVHLMVGNHDEREAFWKCLSKETEGPRPIAHRQIAIVEHRYAIFFLLDSLDETDESPGALGKEQCAWLAKELDARPDKTALVCVHHPPLVGAKEDSESGITDTNALLDVIVRRRQVKAVICGHTHRWKLSMFGDLHLVNLPAIGYPSKSGAPTGWVTGSLLADGMRVVLHSRDSRHKDHLRPIELTWRVT